MSASVEPQPSVSLMFTDIEGSTKLLGRLRDGYANVLDDHRSILRESFERHGGREMDTQGDSFFVAFESAAQAVACAVEVQHALAAHRWPDGAVVRVRIGIHTGTPTVTPAGFVGIDVHRAARVGAAAHGGQILATEATTLAAGQLPDTVETRSLGVFRFKGLDEPLTVLQLSAPGLASDFPPIRTSAPEDEPPSAGDSPYKGLLRFEEIDADRFFGREEVVAAIAGAVEQQQFVAVVGASGSGKSSIVRAGVVPALRRNGHKLVVITPTADPLGAVAAALSMDDGARALQRFALVKKAVLVVDQLEELFTLCRSESMRADFVAALMDAVGRGVHVLITLRADFYAEVAAFPELRGQVAEHQFYVGPMEPADLRRAIEEPARLGGWDLAPGLVDLLLRDVGAEPGALPLLSHALLETWLRRRGSRLTLKGYFESGEVRGAIARTADRLYVGLLPAEQQIAHEILLRLTELGEGTQDTRRRVTLDALVGEGGRKDGTSDVLRQLVDARLVTVDEGTAEVAHEALIREWPLLREWLAQDRDGLRLQRALTDTAGEWQVLNHDPSLLYRGARLAAATEFAFAHPHSLNAREREFVEASLDAEEEETREREAQQQRELEAARRAAEAERRRAEDQVAANRRLRRRAIILVGAVLLAVGLGVLAAFLGKQATDQAAEAQAQATAANEQKQIAVSRQLGAQSVSTQANLDLSMLLSLEANRVADTLEARSSLLSALLAQPALTGFLAGSAPPSIALRPDGKVIAVASPDDKIQTWDLATREPASDPPLTGLDVAISSDGKLALTGDTNGQVALWEATSGKKLADLIGIDGYVDWVAFGADDRIALASNHEGFIGFWDVGSRELLFGVQPNGERVLSLATSPDGKLLARSTFEEGIQLFEIGEHRQVGRINADVTRGPNSVAFSPDGKTLATAAAFGAKVSLFDVVNQVALGGPHELELPGVDALAFSPDGATVAVGGTNGVIELHDLASWREVGAPMEGHADDVSALAFTSDGGRLVAGYRDGTIAIWEPERPSRIATTTAAHDAEVQAVTFSPDGRTFATMDGLGAIVLWDAGTKQPAGPPLRGNPPVPVGTLAFSPNSGTLLTNPGISLVMWDVRARQPTGPTLVTTTGQAPDVKPGEGGLGAPLTGVFSADGRTVYGASNQGKAFVWRLEPGSSGDLLPSETFDAAAVTHLTLSPDGRTLALDGDDNVVSLWDTETLRQTVTLSAPELEAGNALLAFSHDGKLLATDTGGGSQPGSIVLWDLATKTHAEPLPGHSGSIQSVAFSPDDAYVASAGDDGTIVLWNVATRARLGVLPAPAGARALAFSSDGTKLVAGNVDGSVTLYDVSLNDWRSAACALAGRNLTQAEWSLYVGDEPYQKTCSALP